MAKKIRDPKSPTSVSTRVWCTEDFDRIEELLTDGAAKFLPPDLLVLAHDAGATAGAWPNWLTLGIGMKFFRRWLEEQLDPSLNDDPARWQFTPQRTIPPSPASIELERPLGTTEPHTTGTGGPPTKPKRVIR